ncbi:MAG TPA: ABC transporter permease [Terriglobales bacterium]|nr:ABC transporter permease [Terriglobales bacterium]
MAEEALEARSARAPLSGALKGWLFSFQEFWLLVARVFANIFSTPFYLGDLFFQMDSIGVGSLPIVALTGFFTGAVMALQLSATLAQYGQIDRLGQLVSLSLVLELGPVLSALMVGARNASGMASELGSMTVTEQIDAMRALGTDPMRKLVTPRVLATVVMSFFLTVIADICGIVGGLVYAVAGIHLDANQYWISAFRILDSADVIQGLVKPLIFGAIIATVGCYYGMKARGGTQGVGKATTQAVVLASILIIISDFVLSRLLVGLLGT